MGEAAADMQPSSTQISGEPAYGFNFDFGGGMQQGLPYSDGFVEGGLDITGNGGGMNLLPVPSVLEFLLAGVDNQYDF
jgi:transcriptional regulatory protein AMDR